MDSSAARSLGLAHESFHEQFSSDEVMSWFSLRLNRYPEASDLYGVSKEFYHIGEYRKAATALEIYASLPGAQLPGVHLLGYAHYMSGDLEKSLRTFCKCVNDGYDSDWQLIVEIQLELEAKQGGGAAKE